MNRILMLTLFALATTPPILPAQNDSSRPVTLEECLTAARSRSALLRIAKARSRAAEAKAQEDAAALRPQLRFSARAAQLSHVDPFTLPLPVVGTQTLFPSIDHAYAARIWLQQPIFAGFRLSKIAEASELNAQVAHEEYRRDELNLELDVTVAYWNLYRAINIEKVVAQSLEQVDEHLKDIRNFERQGLATPVDVYRVEVQRSSVEVTLIEARGAIRLAAMRLNNLIGWPLEMTIEPLERPELPADDRISHTLRTYDLVGLTRLAGEHRPELQAMVLRRAMSRAAVTAARGGWYPQLALSAGYEYARPNQRVLPPQDKWKGTWDVGVSLHWNIWDWQTTAHQAAQAEAALENVEAELTQLENAIALQIAQQRQRVEEAEGKLVVAERAVRQATESHRITNEKFKQGLATNADLLDAEVALLQSRLTQTQAAVDYAIAAASLRRAVGIR